MNIINSLFLTWAKFRMHDINYAINNPVETQKKLLLHLVNYAQKTEWGIRYEFSLINTVNDFMKSVPVQNYETIKHDINRIINGEQNILWPGKIKWFSKSSGTTSDKSKFIPISKQALGQCHFKAGKDMLAIICNMYPEIKAFNGKNLTLGGSVQINKLNKLVAFGDLSAVLIKNLPLWAELMRLPDIKTTLEPDFEKKICNVANATINKNITIISGIPTWNIVLFKYFFEKMKCENLLDIWPNLELCIHGGVSFIPYKEQFIKLIPSPKMKYVEIYNASEGFFAIQDQENSDELLLMVDNGIYYEFIPFTEIDSLNPVVISLSDVRIGVNYAIVITTNAGLWRYLIGDTISFTSLKPFRIKITGRTRHFINAVGEEVIINNADFAIQTACNKTGAVIKDYTAGPMHLTIQSKGCHEWLIEFEKLPDSPEHFTETLDNALKQVNSDYEAKRFKDLALERPVIHVLRDGTFYQWMKNRGKLGGQNKVPRLSNDRKYLDSILNFAKEKGLI